MKKYFHYGCTLSISVDLNVLDFVIAFSNDILLIANKITYFSFLFASFYFANKKHALLL